MYSPVASDLCLDSEIRITEIKLKSTPCYLSVTKVVGNGSHLSNSRSYGHTNQQVSVQVSLYIIESPIILTLQKMTPTKSLIQRQYH